MKNETTDRDPRLKQTILTWDFPTRVTVATNDSTYVEKEEDFISQYCLTGYKSIKYLIPTDKAFEANNNTYDGIAYRYAETLLINAEAKAELGTITQADLNKTINVLRDRAGMPHLTMEVGFTDPNWPAGDTALARYYRKSAANAALSWLVKDSDGTTWPVGKPERYVIM